MDSCIQININATFTVAFTARACNLRARIVALCTVYR